MPWRNKEVSMKCACCIVILLAALVGLLKKFKKANKAGLASASQPVVTSQAKSWWRHSLREFHKFKYVNFILPVSTLKYKACKFSDPPALPRVCFSGGRVFVIRTVGRTDGHHVWKLLPPIRPSGPDGSTITLET